MGFLSNFISNVSNTVGGVIGNVVSTATNSIGGLASQVINAATPVVSTAVNSTAAQIAASGFSGAGSSAAQIAAANTAASQPKNVGTMVNIQGKIVRLDKLTGLAKFFCYYKMDSDGRVYLEDGKPLMNYGKVVAHATVLGVVVFAFIKMKRKKW